MTTPTSSLRSRTVRGWAGLLATALLLAGCGSSAAPSTPSAKMTAGLASSLPPPVAIGQTVFRPDRQARVVGDGQLFATALNTQRTIRTFNLRGRAVATISTSAPVCEIGLFASPAGRQLVYAVEYTNRPASGSTPATETVELAVYDAQAGSQLWRSLLLPATAGTASCEAVPGSVFMGRRPASAFLAQTQDKRFVLVSLDGPLANGIAVANTATGAVTTANISGASTRVPGQHGRVMSNDVIRMDNGTAGFAIAHLIDPAAGAGSRPLATSAFAERALPLLPVCGSLDYVNCAASGGGVVHTKAVAGTDKSALAVASLPGLTDRFSVAFPAGYDIYEYGDDPNLGTIVATSLNGPNAYIAGYRDTTGQRLWQLTLPGSAAAVCGLGNGHALVAVNHQLLSIDLRDGSSAVAPVRGTDCPVLFGDGYVIDAGSGGVVRVV